MPNTIISATLKNEILEEHRKGIFKKRPDCYVYAIEVTEGPNSGSTEMSKEEYVTIQKVYARAMGLRIVEV